MYRQQGRPRLGVADGLLRHRGPELVHCHCHQGRQRIQQRQGGLTAEGDAAPDGQNRGRPGQITTAVSPSRRSKFSGDIQQFSGQAS